MNAALASDEARASRLGKLEQEQQPEQRQQQQQQQQQQQPEPESNQPEDAEMDELEPTVEDLGMGWSRVTEQDGAVFYWHEASEVSQWEPPAHLVAPEPGPAPAQPVVQRQLQTVSGLKLPVVMERSEDEQRRSPDDASPDPGTAQPAEAASGTTGESDSTSHVKHMVAHAEPALTKAQPLREPLQRQMYRGSNSDTQLTWGTKLAWADSDADEGVALRAGASPCTVRAGSSNRVRKDKTVHWEEWTVDEVLVWLASLDIEVKECSEVFRKQRVKGKHLKKLDDELLLKLGIDAFGDRDAILEARDRLSDDQERILLAAAARATGSNPNSPVVKSLPSPGPGTPAAGTPRLKPSSSTFPGSQPPPGERENEAQVLVGCNSGDPLVVYTERPLGGGAAGSVFEGWYQGQFVAVKRMSETEKQAVKELDIYRNSAANRHPNIVFTHGFKVEHGLVYLIMDRCDCSLSTSAGEKSSAFVSKLRISSDLPRDLSKQLLTGVSQLHSLHVIHRDLKPSNVLIRNSAAVLAAEVSASTEKRNSGRQPQICLCDMGLSKRQSADYSISTLGDDVGTVGWRAPELRKAGAQATEASDVYAAGLIIYYILTGGCHVFDDDDEEEQVDHTGANERQLSQLSYARQEAIDECGREWERVQKYGSRASTTNVFALSASHRDLLSAEKEAEREQLMEGIVERLSRCRVHNQPSATQGAGAETLLLQSVRLPSSRPSNDGSTTELSTEAVSLLSRLLHPDPKKRPTAGEALADPVFQVVLEGQDQIAESELTIGGVIGDGAMGIVYRAKWRETDVAVKRLKHGDSQNQTGNDEETQLKGDFVREVALLKRLRHPHVVLFMGWFLSSSSYLAADAEHESLCFVTELCWTSLYHLLHANGGSRSTGEHATNTAQHLHWPRRLAMCLDAAKGMCFLHGEGIIHRDLKSANLLVDRSYRVKVCDFGLARALSTSTGGSRRRVGTPQYDAPEVIVDGKPGDQFSDVYSFGVVLWEVALLRKPHGTLATQVGNAGALYCAILESYSQNVGLPMDDWPTAPEAEGNESTNAGGGAMGLIGEDLRQVVEACLRLKHSKQTPRPTFEAIASALAAMLQKLRHQANMERRQAERTSMHGGGRTRFAAGGIVTGAGALAPRREVGSDNISDSLTSGTGLPASPEASQRGGLMARLSPIAQTRSDAGSDPATSDAILVSPAPQNSTARPPVLRGGRRVVHTLRTAPGASVNVGVHSGPGRPGGPSPTPTPPSNASPSPPPGGPRVALTTQVTTAEAARRAARSEE